jgi:hypothetical protein
MDRLIEGGCFCGRLRYSATGEPLFRALCHCRSCRHAAGSGPVAWLTFRQDQVTLRGEPSAYSSSPGVEWSFCRDCGTLIAYRRDTRAGEIDLTTASLDEPDGFAPGVEIWTQDRMSWVRLNDDLPHRLRVTE